MELKVTTDDLVEFYQRNPEMLAAFIDTANEQLDRLADQHAALREVAIIARNYLQEVGELFPYANEVAGNLDKAIAAAEGGES